MKPDLKNSSLKISINELDYICRVLNNGNKFINRYIDLVDKLEKDNKILELLKLTDDGEYNSGQKRFLKKFYKKEDVNYLFNPSIYERLFIDKVSDYEEIIERYSGIIEINVEKLFKLIMEEEKDEKFYLEKYKDIINWSEVVKYLTNKNSEIYNDIRYENLFQYFDFKNVRDFPLSFFNNVHKFSKNNLKTVNLKFLMFSLEKNKSMNIKNKDKILDLLISEKIILFDTKISDYKWNYGRDNDDYYLIESFSNIKKELNINLKSNNKIVRYILENKINVLKIFYYDYDYDYELDKIEFYSNLIFYSDIIISKSDNAEFFTFIKKFLKVYKNI
jgi:hypothetical protein